MVRKYKVIFINVGISLISIIACLFAAEIGVRIFLPQRTEQPLDCFMPDNIAGWKLRPNFNKKYIFPEYEMVVNTNKIGFRDNFHPYEKAKDSFRILGIGDSFLFGYGINDEDNVLRHLYRFIKQDSLFKNIEIINLGIPGYDLKHYYQTLKYYGYKYNPDMVIVFFFINDWTKGAVGDMKVNNKGFLITGENFSFKSIRSFLQPVRIFLKRHSNLYILVRSSIRTFLLKTRLMVLPEIDIYKKDQYFGLHYQATFKMLSEISRLCSKDLRSKFLLCIIPERIQVDKKFLNIIVDSYNVSPEEYDWLQPQNTLVRYCLDNRIKYVDLTPAFIELEGKQKLYYEIDPHWTAYGHISAAKELFKYIRKHE